MDSNYSLGDIRAATEGGEGMFGGGGLWIFALLILLLLGNGGGLFGGANAVTAATTADIQRAVDLNSIQTGQANIAADIQRGIYEINGATKDVAYNNLSEIRDVQAVINSGFAEQQKCCCETLRAIDGVNYNGALNTASINANTTAQTQKILDAITCNRMADMQNQINALQLQSAMCGVIRYPNSTTYTAGSYMPFYTSGCGCNSNI